MSERKVWGAFLLLALTWGSSFLFIKVALESLQPVSLVSLRLLVGTVGLLAILRWQGLQFPHTSRLWQHLALLGLVNVAIPFVLITWSETGIDTGVVAVLNSTVPLFSILISGVILRVEEVTVAMIAGLVIGFMGVILLVGPNLVGGVVGLAPYGAVVAAAVCYAAASAYVRHFLRGVSPVVVSLGQLLVAFALVTAVALVVEDPSAQSLPPLTLLAIVWLGLLGSCLAYILYFYVLEQWGATRATLVTYLIPIVAVAAGVIFLNEALEWRLVVGGLLILSGVGVVNQRRSGRGLLRRSRHGAE